MKIFLFCNPQSNQVALAHKIYKKINIDEIILCEKKIKKNIIQIIKSFLSNLFTFFLFRISWFNMLKYYQKKFKNFPIKPNLIVDDINSKKCREFIINLKPDLVLVSGTNLLKKDLIDLININGKIMNLHTGISPYVKGGPNCTNWCLYSKKFNLIGSTVHWIDPGIDSGDIITTRQADLDGEEDLTRLHIKVMESAHKLYISAILSYLKNKNLKSIKQSQLSNHKLYKTKDWTFYCMIKALFNFYFFYNKKKIKQKKENLIKLT